MSLLSDISGYWTATSALNTYTYYAGRVSEDANFPYVVGTLVSSHPDYNTGSTYIMESIFDFDIWADTLAQAETIAGVIDSKFERVKFVTRIIASDKNNELLQVEFSGAYHLTLEYRIMYHRTIAS